jgi:hypothetical protein
VKTELTEVLITRLFRDELGRKLIPETRIGTTSHSPPTTVIGEHLACHHGSKHLFLDFQRADHMQHGESYEVDTSHQATCRADGQSPILFDLGKFGALHCRIIGSS